MKIQNSIKIPACAEVASAGRQNSKFKILVLPTATVFLITLFTFVMPLISKTSALAQSDQTFTVGQEIQAEEPAPPEPAPAPTPAPVSGPAGGLALNLWLLGFSVLPDFNQAVVSSETNLPTRTTLRWGQSPDYESGILISEQFELKHQITIPDLRPATVYYFELELTDSLQRRLIVSGQSFRTLSRPVVTGPFNVSNLQAFSDGQNIILSWRNPPIDFAAVRIIRSVRFFPGDPFDGQLVYENRGERFVDRTVKPATDYFYAVFVRDREGRYSSGALTRGRLLPPGETLPPLDLYAGVVELPPGEIHPLFRQLTLRDFQFLQADRPAEFVEPATVMVRGDQPLRVSLDYDKLPEVLKTVAITLTHPNNPANVFSFLLRVNPGKTSFESVLAPLGEAGSFGLKVAVLDHKNRGLKKLSGFLESILPPAVFLSRPVGPEIFFRIIFPFLAGLLTLLFFVWRFRPFKPKPTLRAGWEQAG